MVESAHPALIFINGIGDHFINLPAVRALADLFTGKLTLVCRRGACAAFFADVSFRSVCETCFMDTERGRIFDTYSVMDALRGCDLLLSLNPWHSEAVDEVLYRVAPLGSIGFFSPFEIHLPLNFDKHSADLAFDVPRFLDPLLSIDEYSWIPHLPPRAISAAATILDPLPPNCRVMAVHADSTSEKMWPARRLVRVLDAFLRTHRDVFALVVGRKPLSLDNGRVSERVVPCYGLPLMVSVALVASADLFLGIDSCMLHVADMFHIPGVGLFGPTKPHEFGFRFAMHRHAWGRGSMTTIGVEEVLYCLESLVISQCARRGPAQTRKALVPIVL